MKILNVIEQDSRDNLVDIYFHVSLDDSEVEAFGIVDDSCVSLCATIDTSEGMDICYLTLLDSGLSLDAEFTEEEIEQVRSILEYTVF